MLGYRICNLGNEIGNIYKRNCPYFLSTLVNRECKCPSLSFQVVTHNFLGQLSLLPLTSNTNSVGFEPSIRECALNKEVYSVNFITSWGLYLFHGMDKSAFRARAWSAGMWMGSWASDNSSSLSSLDRDFTSAANWAPLSPPLDIVRTLLMPLVRRLSVHLLAWELGTRQLGSCTKVIDCY